MLLGKCMLYPTTHHHFLSYLLIFNAVFRILLQMSSLNRRLDIVFLAALMLVFMIAYGYQWYAFEPPKYMHQWRQADGAMFARNYLKDGLAFWETRGNNLYGTNDSYVVSEFPLLYYLAALLSKLFGFQHWYVRVLSLLLFFGAAFAFRNLAWQITQNRTFAIVAPLLFFTSPIVVFYAPNFLPDMPAISSSIIGLWLLWKGINKKQFAGLVAGAVFTALAGLLKAPALALHLAACGTLVWLIVFEQTNQIVQAFRSRIWLHATAVLLPLVTFVAWFMYLRWFQGQHPNGYFTLNIVPVWKSSPGAVVGTLIKVFYTFKEYLSIPGFILVLTCIAWLILRPNKRQRGTHVFLLLYTLALLAYFLLFFPKFYQHDYYAISMMPVIPIAVVFGYRHFSNISSGVSRALPFALMVFAVLSFANAAMQQRNRTKGYNSTYTANNEYLDIENTFIRLGIAPDARMISLGDKTSGVTLYFMNRDGWTDMTFNMEPQKFEKIVSYGAQYVTTQQFYEPNDFFRQCISNGRLRLLGSHRHVSIYRIEN